MSGYNVSVGARASDYTVGDWVVRYNSHIPGLVVAVHPGIEQVDVEYSTGWEREEPEDLILLSLYSQGTAAAMTGANPATPFGRLRRIRKMGGIPRVELDKDTLFTELFYAMAHSVGTRRTKIATSLAKRFTDAELNAQLYRFDQVQSMAQGVKTKGAGKKPSAPGKSQKPKQRFVEDLSEYNTYARKSYRLKSGKRLRIVFDNKTGKFLLLRDKRILMESKFFSVLNKVFQRLTRRDKRYSA